MDEATRRAWIWWNLPSPPSRTHDLIDLIEEEPAGVRWNSQAQTEKLIGMMSKPNLDKLRQAMKLNRKIVGGLYRRTRKDADGNKIQRTEVRFDSVAGCLRTPSGGSSRQSILYVEGERVRSRLLSPREAARLMGLPDSYALPANYNDAYHVAGDGVVVPAVRFLAKQLLEPMLALRPPHGHEVPGVLA
jgi:DNA (cytosine-5)-methyltransferase 1